MGLKRTFQRLSAIGLLLGAAAVWALPSSREVEQQVQKGDYVQAESMMREVVQAKPDSAKAQYVYAELLAHNGRFREAAEHAARARSLDPQIRFTAPDKFRSFESLLQREQQAERERAAARSLSAPAQSGGALASAGVRAEPDSGLPIWVWGLGAGLFGLLVWRLVAARVTPQAAYGGPAVMPAYGSATGPMTPPGYGGGYAPAPASSGLGAGLLGAAGGVAAGMLLEKALHGHDGAAGPAAAPAGGNGLSPGYFDGAGVDPSARELQSRDVDFGSGASWDGGDGGAFDAGGDAGGGDSW